MIRAWMPSYGVRSRFAPVSMSTSYSRQFSSPPVSWMYSRCRASLAQAKARMPRSVSSVTTCAASQSTPPSPVPEIGATQTFSTPSRGAIQASRVASGEICGLTRSGLPNSTSRGMRTVMPNAYHTRRSSQSAARSGSPQAYRAVAPTRRSRPYPENQCAGAGLVLW